MLKVGWSWREESNLQPAVYKTAALPIELRQRFKQTNELVSLMSRLYREVCPNCARGTCVTLPEDLSCRLGMPRHINCRLPLLNTCDTFRRMTKRKNSEEPAGSWVFRDLPGNFNDQDEDCRCGSEKIRKAMSCY